MIARTDKEGRGNKPPGLFLFFVFGLFLLQITFAFTIHGDIGPQTPVHPGINRPAPATLVGRIESLVSRPAVSAPAAEPVSQPLAAARPPAAVAPAPRQTLVQSGRNAAAGHHAGLQDPRSGPYLEYTVRRGDTLDGISRRLFGSTRMVTALVRLNRLTSERRLQCGERLRIPRHGLKTPLSPDLR